MQIKTVHYSALINLGNYNNERIGFTAEVGEGESIEGAIAALKEKVATNATLNADKVRSALYKGQEELSDLERKIKRASEEWNAIAEFLRAQGIKPDAVDMPKFTNLLPEVKDERVHEGEIEDEESESESEY